ncbi:hypothetical protein D3C73_827030 [compost metagenome]
MDRSAVSAWRPLRRLHRHGRLAAKPAMANGGTAGWGTGRAGNFRSLYSGLTAAWIFPCALGVGIRLVGGCRGSACLGGGAAMAFWYRQERCRLYGSERAFIGSPD